MSLTPPSEVRKTPSGWCRDFGQASCDQTYWHREGKDWAKPVTYEEFCRLLGEERRFIEDPRPAEPTFPAPTR